MIHELENFESEIKNSEGLSILEVYSQNCIPCKKVISILEPFSNNIKIYKADAKNNSEILSEFNIKSVPTLLFFIDGEIDKTLIGSDSSEIMSSICSYAK